MKHFIQNETTEKGVMSNTQVSNAVSNYIDYFLKRGAKKINIDFSHGFNLYTDLVLSKDEIESKEHMKVFKEVYKVFSA